MGILQPSLDLSTDLTWLRSLNVTHFALVVVFYLLWRLPGAISTAPKEAVEVWFDAVQHLPEKDHGDNGTVSTADTISAGDDEWLANQVKESTTAAERLRFFVAKKRNRLVAAQSLQVYTDWHLQHANVLTSSTSTSSDGANHENLSQDDKNWKEASLIALKVRNEKHCHEPLPKLAHMYQRQPQPSNSKEDDLYIRDKTGRRIVHFTPGRMDDRVASTVTYALALALYIDRSLDRESDETITVVIDARGSHGWRNPHAAQLLPFIQHLAKLMLTMFPERLHRAVVFPIPPRFFWIWRLARNCVDPLTREKICPLTGACAIESPAPMDQIAEYIGWENAVLLEDKRKTDFSAL